MIPDRIVEIIKGSLMAAIQAVLAYLVAQWAGITLDFTVFGIHVTKEVLIMLALALWNRLRPAPNAA